MKIVILIQLVIVININAGYETMCACFPLRNAITCMQAKLINQHNVTSKLYYSKIVFSGQEFPLLCLRTKRTLLDNLTNQNYLVEPKRRNNTEQKIEKLLVLN